MKHLFSKGLLLASLFAVSTSFADTAYAPPPRNVAAAPTVPAPGYPNLVWPYNLPAAGTAAVPTAEVNAYNFLPYLPWIGANLAQLVNYADFFYQLEKASVTSVGGYKTDVTMALNLQKITADQNTVGAAAKLTLSNITRLLSPSSLFFGQALLSVPGTDTAIPCQGQNCPVVDNSAFDVDTLLGSDGYDSTQQTAVNNLMSFLSGMAQPLPTLALSSDTTTRNQQLSRPNVQQFLLAKRAIVAAQSLAISNLNYLAQERSITKGLGTQAGMTTLPTDGTEKPVADASLLQLEKFMINRRVGNTAWYQAMNNASPAVLQRETLYVLAEMQQQMLQMQMTNERLLATMSMIQMQANGMATATLGSQQIMINKSLGG